MKLTLRIEEALFLMEEIIDYADMVDNPAMLESYVIMYEIAKKIMNLHNPDYFMMNADSQKYKKSAAKQIFKFNFNPDYFFELLNSLKSKQKKYLKEINNIKELHTELLPTYTSEKQIRKFNDDCNTLLFYYDKNIHLAKAIEKKVLNLIKH